MSFTYFPSCLDAKYLWFRNYIALLLSQHVQRKNMLFLSANVEVNLLVWTVSDRLGGQCGLWLLFDNLVLVGWSLVCLHASSWIREFKVLFLNQILMENQLFLQTEHKVNFYFQFTNSPHQQGLLWTGGRWFFSSKTVLNMQLKSTSNLW